MENWKNHLEAFVFDDLFEAINNVKVAIVVVETHITWCAEERGSCNKLYSKFRALSLSAHPRHENYPDVIQV